MKSGPQPLPEDAAQIMEDLTAGMSEGATYRKIDNAKGPTMPVFVARLGPNSFEVGHFDEHDHCDVTGPSIEMRRGDGAWYPCAVTRLERGFDCVLIVLTGGKLRMTSPGRYGAAWRFATALLREIKSQQGDLRP